MNLAPDDGLATRVRDTLLGLLSRRHGGTTICPSEAARRMAREFNTEWRDMMRVVRCVAADLADHGSIEAVQDGRAVDLREARGPIRLRLKRAV